MEEAQIDLEKEQTHTFLDELKDFLFELWYMLKQDFYNSIEFISSNKSFFTTAAILAILLQITSISYLGTSFEKYCGEKQMRGGGGENQPQVLSYQDYKSTKQQMKADKKAEKRLEKQAQKIDKKASAMKAANQKKGISQSLEHYKSQATEKLMKKEDDLSLKKGKLASIANYKAGVDEAREQDKLLKSNKERISFFEGIKKRFQSTLSPGALGGPLFGRLDLIFDSVKSIFYIITLILTIVGVLSLPVLVFLILTYYVFKTMISKFIIL